MATAVRHEGHVHIVCCSFENGDFLFHDLSEELVPLEGPPGSWKIYFDQNGLGYISSGITSIWVSTLLSEAVYQVEQEGIMKFYLKKAGVVSWLSSKFKEQARSLHILALDGATSTMVFTYFTLSIAGVCTTKVEILIIPRPVLKQIVDRFSPWLENRLDSFRQDLLDYYQSKTQRRATLEALPKVEIKETKERSAASSDPAAVGGRGLQRSYKEPQSGSTLTVPLLR